MSYSVRACLALVACLLWGAAAHAQAPVFTLVTLSGVGSQSDAAARYFAPLLAEQLGQPVVVANHPGGQGAIGMKKFHELPADCTSAMIGHTAIAYVSKFGPDVGFDPMKAFVPVHGLSKSAMLVLVSTDSGITNIAELIQWNKRNKRLTGASAVPMTAMTMGLLDRMLGVKTEVINYKSAPQSALDMAAGLVDYTVSASGNGAFQALIDAGKLRPIAVTGEARSAYYADVLTLTEQGFGPVEDFAWNGFFIHERDNAVCQRRLTSAIWRTMRSDAATRYSARVGYPQRHLASGTTVEAQLEKEYRALVKPAE